MDRRNFIKAISVCAAAGAGSFVSPAVMAKRKKNLRYLRPPGALPDKEFLARCIRCGQCGEICPNKAINFFDFEDGVTSFNTPYILPREQRSEEHTSELQSH